MWSVWCVCVWGGVCVYTHSYVCIFSFSQGNWASDNLFLHICALTVHLYLPFQNLSSRVASAPNLVRWACRPPPTPHPLLCGSSLDRQADNPMLFLTFSMYLITLGDIFLFQVKPPCTTILGHKWNLLTCSIVPKSSTLVTYPFVGKVWNAFILETNAD